MDKSYRNLSNKELKDVTGGAEGNDFFLYTVKDTDSLPQIAQKYGISVKELCDINKIADHAPLKIGTKLKIPYKN